MIWNIGRYLTPGEAWGSLLFLLMVVQVPRYHRCFHVSCAGKVEPSSRATGPCSAARPDLERTMRVETRPDVTLLREMEGSETHSGKVDGDGERAICSTAQISKMGRKSI